MKRVNCNINKSHVSDLKQAFNLTEQFLVKIANTSEEFRYHTTIEMENLEKLLTSTKVMGCYNFLYGGSRNGIKYWYADSILARFWTQFHGNFI